MSLFTLNRLGRAQFLAYTNIVYGLVALVYYFMSRHEFTTFEALFDNNPVGLILLIIFSFLPLKFLAQRYRDAGVSGWWALVGLIPYSYILLYFLMGLFRGEHYTNEYGDRPESPKLMLRLLGYLPLIIIAGYILWYVLTSTRS